MKLIQIIDQLIHKFSKTIKENSWLYYKDHTQLDKNDNFCAIDLLITLIDKDIIVAEKCIESVRKFSLNKINNVYIIAPVSIKMKNFCKINNCIFIDEDIVSPYSTKALLDKGIIKEKVGWIKQQLIKLNSDTIDNLLNKYLIIDADTILLKPQYFSKNGIDVLKFSDEFHFLYKKSNQKILGSFLYSFRSFISHHQLIEKKTLNEMKFFIFKHHLKKWHDVFIDTALKYFHFVSEYELYAQYCIENKKMKVCKQYWFNINNKYEEFKKMKKVNSKAKSISYHNYQTT